MSKNTKWILLFAFLMLAYGISQWLEDQKTNEFKSPLLTFLPKDVERINIQASGTSPFQLLKLDQQWFLSTKNVHEPAKKDKVEQLLKLLKSIRTAAIISQNPKDWRQYELTDEQGTLICIETQDKKLPCLKLGLFEFSSEQKTLQTFARIQNENEIYSINGTVISQLGRDPGHYRNQQLLSISDPLQRIQVRADTLVFTASRWNNDWVDENLVKLDSLQWLKVEHTLTDLQLSVFADEIDELSLNEQQLANIHIYTAKDSFVMDIFHDSTLVQPFILHSSQFPTTWMACDSLTFFNIIPIQAWNKVR